MEEFWKATAAILLTVILGLAAGNKEKDIAVLLTMTACCIASGIMVSYLQPVIDLLWELEAIGEIQGSMLGILLKMVGIALVAELAGMICSDAGNGSLGKAMQMLGSAAIMYLAIPIFRSLLTLIQEILGKL